MAGNTYKKKTVETTGPQNTEKSTLGDLGGLAELKQKMEKGE